MEPLATALLAAAAVVQQEGAIQRQAAGPQEQSLGLGLALARALVLAPNYIFDCLCPHSRRCPLDNHIDKYCKRTLQHNNLRHRSARGEGTNLLSGRPPLLSGRASSCAFSPSTAPRSVRQLRAVLWHAAAPAPK